MTFPRFRLYAAAACFAATGLTLAARQSVATDPATAPLSATIPVDAAVTTGTFDNGLRYYVRANGQPENRAELRLVVNAGSVLEDDDQRGLAHFVEHMAFNGTANFPAMDIVSFMESIGMRFGPSVNAFTSFDETVYQLRIPTDDPAVAERAMLILEDWAHRVSFDPDEIDRERGVIIEEWRLRRGAAARVQDQQLPVLLAGSRYADRLPIGTVENLQSFTHDRLTRFYRDWYRPDLMAVIAVGDFDPAAMTDLIRRHFAAIPPADPARPRPVFDVPPRRGTDYAVTDDPELTTTQVEVYHTRPAPEQATVGAYRDGIVARLFSSMLNDRLGEIARRPDAPFLQAAAGRGTLVRSTEARTLRAVVRENEVERGLAAVMAEAERVARFGFTATELDRQKLALTRLIERLAEDRDNHESSSLAAEYRRSFLTGEPIPGIDYERQLHDRFLPEITLEEVNALARDWVPDRDRVVLVSAPDRPDAVLPADADLAAVLAGVESAPLEPYVDAVADRPLMATLPPAGTIADETVLAEYDITEWTLSNGARVVLKPTDFREDEILFRAFSPGGYSLVEDEAYVTGRTAGQIIGAGGLDDLSALELDKLLTGRVASVRPSIGEHEEQVSGSASRQDLETLFQRLYLTFTAPRADEEIFAVITEQTRIALANQVVRPGYALSEALNEAMTQGHPRARLLTPDDVDAIRLDHALQIYEDRFGDAGDFTFVFVGSFTPELLRPYVEQYLAALPSAGRVEAPRDFGIEPAAGITRRRVEQGIEPQSQARIVFPGPFEYTPENRALIRAMAMVLERRLLGALRENLGGTYSVGVSPAYSRLPTPRYSVQVAFGSDPARTDGLAGRVFEEIERLQTEGPDEDEVADVREILQRDLEASLQQNAFLLANLAGRYETGEPVATLFTLDRIYAAIDGAAIQQAARTWLDLEHYVDVRLFPEG